MSEKVVSLKQLIAIILIVFALAVGITGIIIVKQVEPILKQAQPIIFAATLNLQIAKCWDIPPSLTQEQLVPVDVDININRDHTIRDAHVVDEVRLSTDKNFKAMADTALNALRRPECARLNLPDNNYEEWKEIIFTFDPRDK